ncbi:MAG TPA: DUF5698 domain-containing protein [Candidatus Paceibacterota bacterium]|nr:DUF5698 domain-containing protein [Candidatus Paceibacterota bacterium]
MEFVLYFLAGIVQDFLVTLDWRFIAKNKVAPATLLSFLGTVVAMLVLYNILTQLDANRGITAIIVYAAGIAAGTFLGMKFKFGLKD